MSGARKLTTSHWLAEDGEIRDVTVCETIRHAAATVPDRLALVDCVADPDSRREWTYAEFLSDAERAARALLARFSPGDRIALWAPNSAEWIIAQQGVSLAGMVLVALNPAYRVREMQFVLEQSGAVAVFCVDSYRGFDMVEMVEGIRAKVPALREVLSLAHWDEFLDSGDPATELPTVEPHDMIQVQYTSGTTGFPKGAMLHHMGLVNEATFVAERAGMSDGGVYINAMPMYHIGGGAVTSFGAWSKRGTFVILPGFDPGTILEAFETYHGTHTLVVPTMLIAMLDHPDLPRRDLSSLQTILSGAASVPASLVRRTMKLLGCQFSILFGQTETHGVVSQTRVTDTPGLGPFRTPRLAAAVSNAGGLGTVSMPGMPEDLEAGARTFREHIEECASLTDRPFAVNIPVGVDGDGTVLPFTDVYVRTALEARRDPAIAERLTVLTTSAGFPGAYVDVIRDAGLVHQHKVGTTRQAVKAAEAGVDVVIAAGFEMGGHAPSKAVHTYVLVPSVTEAVDVPVLLTGGARDGRGLAAALAMGAEGVAMGTRFITSTANTDWHPAYLQAILDAQEGDDVAFDGVYGPCRGLRNAASEELLGHGRTSATGAVELTRAKIESMQRAQTDGDVTNSLVLTGQVASAIHDVVDVASFVPGMADEAAEVLRSLASRLTAVAH